jgi:hypothetical protein
LSGRDIAAVIVIIDRRHNLDTAGDLAARQDHGIRPLRLAHLAQRLAHVGSLVVFDFHAATPSERQAGKLATGTLAR